ncbi:MAG: NHL domain-containing thioredoxin family protein [Actinomycetes bacterium]
MSTTSRRPRVRAPELTGRAWLNTGGRDLRLSDLRGRVVVLDFWTFCCVNCLHVLDELRPLEEAHADALVVVGVHSPKFVHEADPQALVDAVERYGVHHPVLDDPELSTWSQYAVRAWPTLVVVDPEGYVVAQLAGEGHGHGLDRLLAELVAEHEAAGTLRRGDGPYVPPPAPRTSLRFPGKLVARDDGTYLVSDTRHHSLAVLDADGETVLRRIGDGARGLHDGPAERARFAEPQGVCLLPDHAARAVGMDAVVADTVNHALRGVRLDSGEVTTLAGTGQQWWQGSPVAGPARTVPLSSPWDVAWFADRVHVAMAGVHQIWAYDPRRDTVEVVAGTTNEGLVDGPAREAWLAQPSGLAVSPDGMTLWVADSETSALRALRLGPYNAEQASPDDAQQAGAEPVGPVLSTAVGQGLFEFGHVDGPAAEALLQHPLGVTALPDGSVAICDTYNDAIRRYDPATGEVSTLATGLREPSAAVVADEDHLVVVESAAHRLTRARLPAEVTRMRGAAHRTQRPVTDIAPGELDVEVVFTPPAGQVLDEREGPATRLVVSSSPSGLLAEGNGAGTGLQRRVRLADGFGAGVLHVSAMAASCDAAGGAEFPACHVHQQDWGIPVRVTPDGRARLGLVLAGLDVDAAGLADH